MYYTAALLQAPSNVLLVTDTNIKVIRRYYSSVQDRGRVPCFRQTKDVTVSYVSLELILALILSTLFSKYWILVSRMLSRGGLWALFLSLLRIPAHFPWSFLIHRFGGLFKRPLFISAFWRISNGHDGLEDKVSWNRLVFRCPMSKSVPLS